jgi:hypothetical protein
LPSRRRICYYQSDISFQVRSGPVSDQPAEIERVSTGRAGIGPRETGVDVRPGDGPGTVGLQAEGAAAP